MSLLDEMRARRAEILAAAERCGLMNIRVFGSVARREEDEKSDIDLLVDVIPESTKGWEVFGFPMDVEDMFGRKVDMVFDGYLNKWIGPRILAEAQAL